MQKAFQVGFKTVFYSGHYFEKNDNPDPLKALIKYARELGLYPILDISKVYFSYDLVNNYAPDALRLDFGSLEDLLEIIKLRWTKRLAISYNFYPKPYTRMDISELLLWTKALQEYHLPVFTFLAVLEDPRGPLFQGLSIIEKF